VSAGAALPAQGDEFIRCTVGARQLAFRAVDVAHTARVDRLRPGADADGRIGSLDISGQAIPVFDLGRTLGAPPSAGTASPVVNQHIAVTGRPGELVGWVVDGMAPAVWAGGTTIVPLPPMVGAPATSWFQAVVRYRGDSVLVLTPSRLRCEPMSHVGSAPPRPRADVPRFAIGPRQIVAIVKALPINDVPGSAAHVIGVSWWRNALVPVIDFRGRTALEAAPRGRFLLALCGGRRRGGIVAFPIASASSLPTFVDDAFHVGDETAGLLNLDTLLTMTQEL
jgi:chemotaxis signal transduction protein